MRRVRTCVLLSVAALCAGASAANAATDPSLSLSFSPSTVSIGDTSQLTFTLTGGDEALHDVELHGQVPIGLDVASASSPQCGGTLVTTPVRRDTIRPRDNRKGDVDYEVALSGASLAVGGNCSFSIPVAVESSGELGLSGRASGVTTDGSERASNLAYADLTVPTIADPANVTTAFTPDTIDDTGTTEWTVQIANPNTSTALTDARFVVDIPISGVWLTPDAIVADDCGGTAFLNRTYSVGLITGPYVSYRGGSIPPGAQCRITVSMTNRGWAETVDRGPVWTTVTTNEGGKSAESRAWLTKLVPPPRAPDPTPVSLLPSPRFGVVSHRSAATRIDRRGYVVLRIACAKTSPAACSGRATLQARKSAQTVYAKGRFTAIQPGQSKRVRLRVAARWRRSLARGKTIAARLVVDTTAAGASATRRDDFVGLVRVKPARRPAR